MSPEKKICSFSMPVRALYYLRQGGYGFQFVCLFVSRTMQKLNRFSQTGGNLDHITLGLGFGGGWVGSRHTRSTLCVAASGV